MALALSAVSRSNLLSENRQMGVSHLDCGKQVYLGGFDTTNAAARAYDRAAIKFRGVEANINFSLDDYAKDLKQMNNLMKEESVPFGVKVLVFPVEAPNLETLLSTNVEDGRLEWANF